ncbi:MAG: hypothetical protein A3J55_04515 [Candidatus Ryanbacteria bacterium RIFCSPHIGHO2_02_FULL_45_17b]|uniref:DUF4190 domain-containing protein n=1 Tax=Candidatus Ryanbacteria bacterium RIFCSPHIGHO2_01_FULL_45_22 TaxID=1802114 RepID=A0A1G2G2B1_9BACT|nr:MAG: hypothetical protein A2719_05090 [Candidatus Ryanbacteria bacterium RIFCSPHIGHO2_01_FULL_45_22]OGZ47607.1 MAG: hypothetical protein A3J55_04515 [Candidatus Ryanbacteria bacterium RIFCSPHIGHO2_02_FULL_45_17b]
MNITPTRTLAVSSVATALAPLAASAAAGAFDDVIGTVSSGLNTIIIFLFLVATVIFLFGVVRYISAAGDEEKTKEARQMIIWGIIFLAVMVAVWGFVNIVLDFIFGSETPFVIPGAGNVPSQP